MTLTPRLVLCVCLTLGLWLCGCGPKKSNDLPANAVAVVGKHVITAEAFQAELARRAQLAPGRYADSKGKQELLEEMIRFEVMYQKAVAAGYDKDPDIAASLRRMIACKYQEDQLAKLERPKLSAKEIADYYQENPQRFGTPEKIRVALIEFKTPRTATPEKRAEIARKAATVRAEAKASPAPDGTFGLLAQTHSEHQASRYQGGDIGWLTAGDTNASFHPAVLAAIANLKEPGDLAPVIETPTAFYLVKLAERVPARMRPLADVQDGVAYLVTREKERQCQEDLYASMKQGYLIQINGPLLERIEVSTEEKVPPAVPGGGAIQVRR